MSEPTISTASEDVIDDYNWWTSLLPAGWTLRSWTFRVVADAWAPDMKHLAQLDARLMTDMAAERDAARAEAARLEALLNTPELHDFAKATVLEAAHQRERWGQSHDAGKTPEDWFWLLGYLGQKALRAQNVGDTDKALHHTISTAAALANWHAAIAGTSTTMRPGIGPGSAIYPAARAALAQKEPGHD